MKICPNCGDTNVIVFDADNDICRDCGKWFPAVADKKTVYCHACSAAGGADMPIYHLPPACSLTPPRKEQKGWN
jgi:hypothetical protein